MGGEATENRLDSIRWHITPSEYLDPVSKRFLQAWETNTRQSVGLLEGE